MRQAAVIYALLRAWGFGKNPCDGGEHRPSDFTKAAVQRATDVLGNLLQFLIPDPHAVTPSLLLGAAQGTESWAFWEGRPTGTFNPPGAGQGAGINHHPFGKGQRKMAASTSATVVPLLEVSMHLFPSQETLNPEFAHC